MILEELEKQCNGFRDSKQFSLADIEKILGEMKCEKCSLFAKCKIRKLFEMKFCSQFEKVEE